MFVVGIIEGVSLDVEVCFEMVGRVVEFLVSEGDCVMFGILIVKFVIWEKFILCDFVVVKLLYMWVELVFVLILNLENIEIKWV